MESGQCKLHMTEMTVTRFEVLAASLANGRLGRNTQATVERSMFSGVARGALTSGIVNVSVGDFNDGLVDDVLVGAVMRLEIFPVGGECGLTECRIGALLCAWARGRRPAP